MVLALKNANSDLPPIGFCNEFLSSFKYSGCVVAVLFLE